MKLMLYIQIKKFKYYFANQTRTHLKQESLETKLTLRISQEEIDEIDEFLRLNERFPSRSEFIRHSVMDYISRTRVMIDSPSRQTIELSENFEKLIESAVSNGLFKSKNDAITEILERAFIEGIVNAILKTKMEGYSRLMQDMKAFEDMKKNISEAGKESKVERRQVK